ncbi:pleckstrin homology domain-containing family A member 7 [Trichomycterus rosablanca]|uniref:pleckstrin homology domain-containing family A member 7 n=1 Tax=Trichomycterus rosablanca TaxID=2290929 RepID=UPI002F35E1D7
MELELELGFRRSIGMEEQDQDRVSRTSSLVTVSSTSRYKVNEKLQRFGKRSQSVKRDPNSCVVIRGWLYKRDSTGLKLWKRRWFVLSNFCLFYYRDSREEGLLGSLPLPSYKIYFCSPRECKNRKYAFKVVHQGMRSYLLSAETQEDMLGWVRALSQSACMEMDDIINRRCSSYQDFSQMGGSSECGTPPHPDRGTFHPHLYRNQTEPSHLLIRRNLESPDHRGRSHRAVNSDDSRTRALSLDRNTEDHYESRPHSPVIRTGYRLHQSTSVTPPTGALLSPASNRCIRQGTRSDRPPLPSSRITHNPSLQPTAPVCVLPAVTGESDTHTLTALQRDTDAVLTRLCGGDKLLQKLSLQLDHLLQKKEHAQLELDMTHLQLDEWQLDEHVSQKALLQEELILIRARICNLTLEMEKIWVDYGRMESELCVFRSHLQHICNFGLPQERCVAQKQIWMMDDILSGLKPNRKRFKSFIHSFTPTLYAGVDQISSLHAVQNLIYMGEESEAPVRPPLPVELQSTNQSAVMRSEWAESDHPWGSCCAVTDPLKSSFTHSSIHSTVHQ